MPRLIDADALIARWKAALLHMSKDKSGLHPIGLETAIEDVKARPTIDPESLRPKWISVEDRLPERGQEVIVYRNDCVYSMRFWDEKHPLWQSTSHWMPLPEPPKE